MECTIREHFDGEIPAIMPIIQIVIKSKPVNLFLKGKFIIFPDVLNVKIARRHRPINEIPILLNESNFEKFLVFKIDPLKL